MSAGTSMAAQLLKMDDGEFNTTIQDMSVKKLLETISVLQKEMGKEQENFNSLSAELGNLKKNSGQYKSVSKDMAASQRRLTTLMDRSMKCFSQQGQQQNKESATEKNSQKSAPQNRNSTGMPKSKTEVTSINPFVEVQSSNSVSNSGSTSTESVQSTRTSFAEAKNKFSGGQQNGSPILRPKSNNAVDVKRSQSMVNTDSSKRWSTDVSNGVNVDARPKSDIEGVKSSKSETTSVSNVSLKPVSSASTLIVGPLANQSNKFISRSTDNVFNKSNDEVNGKDVVRGKAPNSKPMVVMTADRQYLDLDSFTDRKNLMSELKSFNKELKPVTKNNPEQPKLVKDLGLKDVTKDNKATTQKMSLLSDIRLGKKPSDLKDKNNSVKESGDTKQTKSVIKASEPTLNGSAAVTGLKTMQESVPITKDKDSKTIINGNSNKVNNKSDKGMNGVNVVINAFKEIDETDGATSEITVADQTEVEDQTEAQPASSQSEDSESQSSELSDEEDKFVTEFTFQQKPTITHGGLNTIPEVAKSELLKQFKGFIVAVKTHNTAMSDLSEHVASFENQPITDLVNQRMQRIQELEQMRQERIASHGITPNTEGRHTRRDRIIQQATSRSDRRNYYPGIQRTGPVRSRSFDVDSQPRNDSLFCDTFDSQRSNLFGSRQNGSTENVYRSSPLTVRRDSDTNLAQRAIGLVGSDSGSDSSIPGSVNIQGDVSFSVGFNVPSNLMGSDSSLNREPRSASVTRERDSSVSRRRMRTSNLVTADSGRMSRLYSSRESRTRDSRSRDSRRRRTIQGTDRNIVEALEREKIAVEPLARLSPNVLASSDTDLNKSESPVTISDEKEKFVDKSANYYRPISSYKRKIVVNPDECIPVVAYETEKFIFVHSDGKTYFLDKMHALSRYLRTSYTLPDLTITPPHESEDELGIIESIEGDPAFRYDRLRDICQIKVCSPENEEDPLPTGNEERYQSKSYFTPPRERPSIDNYFASRTVTPLYEGIDMTVFETDENTASSGSNTVNGTVNNQPNMVNGTTNNQSNVTGTSNQSIVVPGTANGDTGTSRAQSHPQVNLITSQDNSNNAEMETESNNVHNVVYNGNILPDDENPVNVLNGHAMDNAYSEMNIDEEYPNNVDLDSDTNYESQDMTVTQYNGANNDIFNVNNQRMVIRETIVEHSVEMEDDAYKNITYTHEHPSDDPLMTHLQMIHESSGVPLDTSHLDYDELQMIQKALAENPSPSPPSSPIHSPSTQPITPTQSIREINYTLPEREEMEGVATRPDRLSTILESPGRLQLPSLDFSPLDKNKSDNDTFTFSPTATEITEPQDVFDNVEQAEEKPQDTYDTHEVDQTHLDKAEALEEKHNDEMTNSVQVETLDELHSEQTEALEEQHNDITDDEDQFTYEEYIQEVPYSFINSPQSPAKTPDYQSRSPSSSFAITRTISSNLEPLSIEIPENSTSDATNDNISKSRSGSHSNSTSVSPLVKSSRDGSLGQPSPFEGETVTTVFEEFVSTIPQNMLNQWSPK